MATDRQTIFEDELAAMIAEQRAALAESERRVVLWGAEIAALNAQIEALEYTLRAAQQP